MGVYNYMINLTSMDPRIRVVLSYVKHSFQLSISEEKRLIDRLWTFSSKVRQPRKDVGSCNEIPCFDRWDINTRTSYLTQSDSRHASKQECEKIFLRLLTLLLEATDVNLKNIKNLDKAILKNILKRNIKSNNLRCIVTKKKITKEDIKKALHYATQGLGSFDIPVGYIKELNVEGKHKEKNIGWIKPFHINYQLRTVLKNGFIRVGGNPRSARNALKKIQIKSYCTDKVTKPPFFSNRDIRWATWTNNYQYVSHYNCCLIELELMIQIFEFINAPKLDVILKDGIEKRRGKPIIENSRKCYITGKDMCFKTYLEGAISPKGGKSLYHVGHFKPLTRRGKHHHANIEWISDDGNRIQGNDTLKEIQEKLIDAVIYYIGEKNRFLPRIIKKLLKLNKLITRKIRK